MNIILIMDSNIENRKRVAIVAFSAAPEPFPLVDIAFVDAVTPLVAVQKRSSVDHHHQRETDRQEVAGRRSRRTIMK